MSVSPPELAVGWVLDGGSAALLVYLATRQRQLDRRLLNLETAVLASLRLPTDPEEADEDGHRPP